MQDWQHGNFCKNPSKFTFPYSENIIVIEVASEKVIKVSKNTVSKQDVMQTEKVCQ